jgi:hypothetical protein
MRVVALGFRHPEDPTSVTTIGQGEFPGASRRCGALGGRPGGGSRGRLPADFVGLPLENLRPAQLRIHRRLRADHVSRDDHIHTSVKLTAGRGAVVGDWVRFAQSDGRDMIGQNSR